MKKILIGALLLLGAWQIASHRGPSAGANLTPVAPQASAGGAHDAVSQAYRQHARDLAVEADGVVEKVLPDDTHGSRHQRFIVRTRSDITVLIAHNIDLAPRVPGLRSGAPIAFAGEYVWNEKGGLVHWTHHDPAGRHAAGWIRYAGETYQ